MIQISLTMALAIYGALIAIGAIFIWLYTEIREQRAYRTLEKQHLWRCVYCAYSYLDEEAVTVSKCPRCGSFNAVDDKKARFLKAPKEALERRKEDRRPAK